MTGLSAVMLPTCVAEVYAVGPVAGTNAPDAYRMGAHESLSPKPAPRWPRGTALWLADRAGPECAAALERRATDPAETERAHELLRERTQPAVEYRDDDHTSYVLTVWFTTAQPPNVRDVPVPEARRVGTLAAPLYADTETPGRGGGHAW